MAKKELLFCCTIVFIGLLDWITTMVAIVFFGLTEANPLLTGLTQSNLLLFSIVKLSAITLTGLVFYKAETTAKFAEQVSPFAKKFLKSGYIIAIITLTALVSNNIMVIAESA